MNSKNIVQAFTVLLLVCILADAQVVRQQGTSEDAEHLRRMLANQPDYTAVPWHFFKNEAGIVGGEGSKVVKMGNRLAEVIANTILIYEPGKPTIKVFPKRKEYAEVTIERKDDFAIPPNDLVRPEGIASRSDVVFKSAGTEKVGEYTCVKIEVSHKDEKLTGVKLLFWVAPELKNLVIQSETSVGGVSYVTLLGDVSLVVNEELFRVPADHKKVSEPDRMKEVEEKLRKPH